ncbi:hypothetical protein RJ55_07371 [Drechmeria coniospora]|nr:hypothetical protein RJ55_07371 [Drechmeria coniospora]
MTTVPFSVSGKTAIITGAGSGIGLAFAELLLDKGCNVLFADIALRPEAKTVVEKHAGGGGPRAVFVQTDVRCWPQLRRVLDKAVAEFGSFDIICPAAGVFEPAWSNFWHPPGSKQSGDDDDGGRYALLDINLTHPIRMTQLALSYWLHPDAAAPSAASSPASPSNAKRAILVSSIAAQLPTFQSPLYGASKAAISSFVRSLGRLDSSLGVRVNAVAPGIVRTPLWLEHPEKIVNLDQERDGWVTAEEVAEVMLRCLQSDDLVGGTIVEIGKDVTRNVSIFNDPGPDMTVGKAMTASNVKDGDAAVWDRLKDKNAWALGQHAKHE